MAITPLPTPPTRSDPANFSTRGDTFMAALPAFATEANALVDDVNATAAAAAASAAAALDNQIAAAASAASAATFDNATGTSITSMAISVANGKVFTTQSGRSWVAGMSVKVFYNATNYMTCTVASYASTTLTLDCTAVVGSGTYASWSIFPLFGVQSLNLFSANTVDRAPVSCLESITGSVALSFVPTIFGKSTDLFVAIASSQCATSADGVTWTFRTFTWAPVANGLAANGNTLIAVSSVSTQGARSTDGGVSWSALTIPASVTPASSAIIFAGGVFCFFPSGAGTTQYHTSPDGTTWTAREYPMPLEYGKDIGSLAKLGTAIVATSIADNATYKSTDDGLTWVKSAAGLAADRAWRGIATNGSNLYVMVNTTGATSLQVATSADGVTWTERTVAALALSFYSIDYGAGLFVAVGNGGVIYTSPDGITWTVRTSGTANFLFRVSFINSNFVAVGNGGTILTSVNGTTWTVQSSGTSEILYDVTWTGTKYVAVATSGVILTSTNLTAWSLVASGSTSNLTACGYGNGQLLIAAQDTSLLVSDASAASFAVTPAALGASPTIGGQGLLWTGTRWLASVASFGIAFSLNGTQWATLLKPSVTGTSRPIAGASSFVKLSNTLNSVARTVDGIAWTYPLLPHPVSATYLSSYSEGAWRAVSFDASAIVESTDAITWTSTPAQLPVAKYSILKYGNAYILGGTSALGNCWTTQTLSGDWAQRTGFNGALLNNATQLGTALICQDTSSFHKVNSAATGIFL